MNIKHLYFAFFLLFIASQRSMPGQETPVVPANERPAETKDDLELNVIRDALSKGSVEAATVMVLNTNPQARQILLDFLKQTENTPARIAICRALNQAKVEQRIIGNRQDFAEPLLAIIAGNNDSLAKLAAEATLIFDYGELQQRLETIAEDANQPVTTRINVIYTLGFHPHLSAAIELIELVDDADARVSNSAKVTLQSLGMPTGQDAESRKAIIDQLEGLGQETFLRNRMIRQRTDIRRLENEMVTWRERYLSALGTLCDNITDSAEKGEFFAVHLNGSETTVKLWALEKLDSLRQGTNRLQITPKLEQVLLELVSDRSRDVRLRTARLLNLMRGELNSAKRLLQQLEIEQDDQVKTELFVALGEVCYYVSLSNPPKVPVEVRKQTLELAQDFLSQQDANKARNGADVISKLLEQDNLTIAEADAYLSLLAKRYGSLNNDNDRSLRGGLLSAMARLCSPQSVHKAEAQKMFVSFFEAALSDQADIVREAAVDGLINIDKAAALSKLRKDFVNDPSSIIRKKLIDLAREVGTQEDLDWLAVKIGTNAESQPAWLAMLEIFKGSRSVIIASWIDKFDSLSDQYKFSDGQRISFFETAEKKALAEETPKLLRDVRAKLTTLYIKNGQFDNRAAECFEFLYQTAETPADKEAILPGLLNVYLRWPRVENVAKLVQKHLEQSDLDPNSAIVRTIEDYLSSPPTGADTNLVIETLKGIKIANPKSRPMWLEQLKRWAEIVSKAVESKKIEE